MAIQTMELDPNAQSYTDNEIVGKVNSATTDITANVDADAISDGTTNKAYTGTEQTKLSGIEDSATADQTEADIKTLFSWTASPEDGATADQSGDEIVSAINGGSSAITREGALSQDDLKIIKTNPTTGEYQIKNIHRGSDGKAQIEYDDVAES